MDKKKIEDIYPLTPAQEGILFHCLAEPEESLYWNQNSFVISGTLDPVFFKTAWDETVEQHHALKAVFNWDNPKRPLQIIIRKVHLSWKELDWRRHDPDRQQCLFHDLLERDRQKGCDLRRGPLMRHYLIRLGEEQWRFLWGNHHILLDGWSVSIVLKDLFANYKQLCAGERRLPQSRSNFRSHIHWLQSQDHQPAKEFFKNYLEGFDEPTPLPVSPHFKDASNRGSGYAEEKIHLDADILQKISACTRRQKLTLNMFFQGLWGLVLSTNCGCRDVVFGAVFSGRTSNLPDIDEMVGLFINALPVRLKVDQDKLFPEWLADHMSIQADSQGYQHTPLRVVQKCTSIPADRPLFESIFVFENYPDRFGTERPNDNLAISKIRSDERDNYPMTLLVLIDKGIEVVLCYDPNRFSKETIDQILDHMQHMIGQLADDFTLPVKALVELPPLQALKVSKLSRSIHLEDAGPETLDLMASHPGNPEMAVVLGENRISHQDMETLVSSWAQIDAFSEHRIGLCFDRSIGMVVAMLAIMRSGSAYVPIDPAWPKERIRWIIADSGLKVVVAGKGRASTAIREAIPSQGIEEPVNLLEMDSESPAEPQFSSDLYSAPPEANSLAYVIYTSGSTGIPKGVLVEHSNVVSSTLARLTHYPSQPSRFLLLSPIIFDSSVAGIFWTLASAGTLILPEPGQEREPEEIAALIIREKISHFLCLPSLYTHILEHLSRWDCSLESVILAGEPCPTDLPTRHRKKLPGVSLYNEYGPTEATVWCTVGDITNIVESDLMHIGRPIPGARIFIVDREGNLLPKGAIGEILVAGPGVARGYLNRPELTEERFITIAISNKESQRAYRTGDLGRWLEDGSLEFLGRIDDQVKIRGYRIETGEIQTVLTSHQEVTAAEIVTIQREGASTQLAGFVQCTVKDQDTFPTELRKYLAERLPEYMVPARIQIVSRWPFLPNGKIDRNALVRQFNDRKAAPLRPARVDSVAGPTLDNLEKILTDILGVETIGPEDNFFALGGDSILAIQAVSKARKAGISLTVGKLLSASTLSDLDIGTRQLETEKPVEESPIGPLPLTPIQSWLMEKENLRHDWWNNSVLVNLDNDIDAKSVGDCLEILIQHHDALRLAVHRVSTGWVQGILPYNPSVIAELDIVTSIKPLEESQELIDSTANRLQSSIKLLEGKPLRAAIFEFGEERSHHLLLIIHHMAVDWVSWKILLEDLEYLVKEAAAGRAPSLPAKTTPFRNWAEALVAYSENDKLWTELDFWKGQPYKDCLSMQLDQGHTNDNQESSEKILTMKFSALDTSVLLEASKIMDAHLEAILLGGLARILGEWLDSPAIQFDLEGHGREEIIADLDTTRTVGWFTSQYPVVLVPDRKATMSVFFQNILAQLEEVPQKGIGFGIMKYMSRQNNLLDEIPESQVTFNYLGKLDDTAASGFLSDARWSVGRDIDGNSLRTGIFEINSFLYEGRLISKWAYSRNLHKESTIQGLADNVKQFLVEAAAAITSKDPLADSGLTDDDLKALFGDSN